MPRRRISDYVWNQYEFHEIEPPEFRQEYAWLLALADNGVFQYDPVVIWAKAYAATRPSVTKEDVAKFLTEFERVKLLYRWEVNRKIWGYWIAIALPGPSKSHSKTPLPDLDELSQFVDSDIMSPEALDPSRGRKC